MKRIFYIFLILCSLSLFGGIVLLNGCSSNVEDVNESVTTPSDENQGEESGDEENQGNDDEEVSANLQTSDYTFKVYAQIKDSSSAATTSSSSSSVISQIFKLEWRSSESQLQPINAQSSKMDPSGTISSDGSTVYASYYYCNAYDNSWWTSYKRYMRASSNDYDYALVGISTSSTFSNTSYTTKYSYAYFYGADGGYTLTTSYSAPSSFSSQIANSNIVNGNTGESYAPAVYLKFRKEYTYYDTSYNGLVTQKNIYAGVDFTLPTSVSERTGYVFRGFSIPDSNTIYQTGQTVSGSLVSGNITSTRLWQPIAYGVSYNSYDGSFSGVSFTSISNVSGSSFSLNSAGYYESSNKGVNNSYSLCKVTFFAQANSYATFYVINYAESNYDFGIFSNLNTNLSFSYDADTSNVYRSFKGSSSPDVQTVTYNISSTGSYYVYIKYRKDSSTSNYNDSLQFRLAGASYKVSDVAGSSFEINDAGYYESTNTANNSYALCRVDFYAMAGTTFKFNVINYAETDFDFGIFSNLNTILSSSMNVDSSGVKKSFKGSSSSAEQVVSYDITSTGSYYIYIKYRKDTSNGYFYDSLQFRVSIDTVPYFKNYTLPTPVKEGYNFLGWYKESSFTNKVTESLYTNSSKNLILYAKWELKTYTLTVNYYGGTTRQTNTTNISISAPGCTVSSSNLAHNGTSKITHTYSSTWFYLTFTRTNTSYDYYFQLGSEPTNSSSLNSTTGGWTPTKDTTINVYVKQIYNIGYSSNGGSGSLPGGFIKLHGVSCTLGTNNLTRPGYTANGWNTSPSGTGTHYPSGGNYTANTSATLYAEWIPNNYIVNFESTNLVTYPYSIGSADSTGAYQESRSTRIENNELIVTWKALGTFNNGPYVSASRLEAGQEYVWSVDIKCSRSTTISNLGHEMGGLKTNVSVSTSWTHITHSFVANSNTYNAFVFYKQGTNAWQSGDTLEFKNVSVQKKSDITTNEATKSMTVTFDSTYANLPTPTRTGCNFVGWYTDRNFTTKISSTTRVSLASNRTLYAKWEVTTAENLKYDSAGDYWYIEEGRYPQSYVGTSLNDTLNNAGISQSGSISTAIGSIRIYSYNGEEYARTTAKSDIALKMSDGITYNFEKGRIYWFKVEPIRWRVTNNGQPLTGWEYGKYNYDINLVSDRIFMINRIYRTNVKEGWDFRSSELYEDIQMLNNPSGSLFDAEVENKQIGGSHLYYRYGAAGQQDKVSSYSLDEDGLRASSIEEMDYLSDYGAKGSDLVCLMFECNTDDNVEYWTRNLGSSLSNALYVNKSGETKSGWIYNIKGVRLSLTLHVASRI